MCLPSIDSRGGQCNRKAEVVGGGVAVGDLEWIEKFRMRNNGLGLIQMPLRFFTQH
jgi:hypothetical protein